MLNKIRLTFDYETRGAISFGDISSMGTDKLVTLQFARENSSSRNQPGFVFRPANRASPHRLHQRSPLYLRKNLGDIPRWHGGGKRLHESVASTVDEFLVGAGNSGSQPRGQSARKRRAGFGLSRYGLSHGLSQIKKFKPKRFDYVIIEGYPTGQHTYTLLGTIHKTVRRFSAQLSKAVELDIQAEPKAPSPDSGVK